MIHETNTYASYNSDLWNASSYVTGSRDFTLAVQNNFSMRYTKMSNFFANTLKNAEFYL